MSRAVHYWWEGAVFAGIACHTKGATEGTTVLSEVTCSRCRGTQRFQRAIKEHRYQEQKKKPTWELRQIADRYDVHLRNVWASEDAAARATVRGLLLSVNPQVVAKMAFRSFEHRCTALEMMKVREEAWLS